MKTKTLILTLLALGAIAAYREQAGHEAPALPSPLPISAHAIEHPEEAKQLAAASPPDAVRQLRRAYLGISLAESDPATKRGLALLAAGLASGDEEIRRRSAQHVENLFVKLAHGQVAMSPEYQSDVSALAQLYKQHAQDQIHRMEKAAPESPTLAFLRNN